MFKRSQRGWNRYNTWRKRQSRVGRFSIRLTEAMFLLFVVNRTYTQARSATLGFIILLGIILAPLLIVLLKRWISRRLLWKVRNRLIVTYLLMGLAPIVLFGTLAGITAYFLAGQYAANVALLPLEEATEAADHEANSLAVFLLLHGKGPVNAEGLVAGRNSAPNANISLALLENDHWHALTNASQWNSPATNPFAQAPVPAWLHPGFRGIVELDSRLYLAAESTASQGDRSVTALATIPLDTTKLDSVARPLGRVILSPGLLGGEDDVEVDKKEPINFSVGTGAENNLQSAQDKVHNTTHDADLKATPTDTPKIPAAAQPHESFTWVRAGSIPVHTHFYDTPVAFSAPVPVIAWNTGQHLPAVVTVISRATVLYARLFATSVKIGLVVRIVLISLAILFGLIEFAALWMALLLSRTITRSVADLYHATAEIDRGNLAHRVAVKQQDQLGALAGSFNRMAASLQDLLAEQREKDRLLNELSIAQEVQQSLFPRSPVSLPGFELHAVCIPARTVSGDYFDFIFGSEDGFGSSIANGSGHDATFVMSGHPCKLCIALGDISGKGISAALLMASLNSAVRAFSLGEGATVEETGCPSPARLLTLINRHLYRSTQPEKYATLFLGFYDTATRRLTYSNAGHLPPVVISSTGRVQKLDCGGTVVGLLDGMLYEEDTVELVRGDLLLAFSDGLTEPENETGEFGEERLLDCVWQHRQLPLPALASNTLKTLQQWIGDKEQPDDMTIMLARPL